MERLLKIKDIKAIQVFDSRSNPTVQVKVILEDESYGIAMVPSGASTGSFEAVELRDNEKELMGKGVTRAVKNVNTTIAEKMVGMNAYNQRIIDETLIELDGTKDKSKLGANATLAVSIAVAKAVANSLSMELYKYIGGISGDLLPTPMMNILNGGKHSDNNLNIQEFMIVPVGGKSFNEKMKMGVEIYNTLKKILKEKGYSTAVGDEGGFAPNLKTEEEAIDCIIKAIKEAGYEIEKDVSIALDIASTEMYEEAKKIGKEGYYFWKTDVFKTRDEMINYLKDLIDKYPIISIEDGLDEEDWIGWKKLTEEVGEKIQLVGDDLFVTNIERLGKGVQEKAANAILIKPNQIGTITETLDTIKFARKNGYRTIISHRSGETEDTTIADLAVAINAGQIKTGAPCRTDRVAKYNRLLNIEEDMK